MRNVPFTVASPSDVAHLLLDHSEYPVTDTSKTVLFLSIDQPNKDVFGVLATEADSPNELLGQIESNLETFEGHDLVIVAPNEWSKDSHLADIMSSLRMRSNVLDVLSLDVETRKHFSFVCDCGTDPDPDFECKSGEVAPDCPC